VRKPIFLCAVAILAAITPPCLCREGMRVDPASGRIRVLFIGDTYMEAGEAQPLMIQDPLIAVTPVLAESTLSRPEDLRRAIRQYLPRTPSSLWSGYDVVVITAVQADTLPADFLRWVVLGVEREGQGFLMADDPASFGGVEFGSYPNPNWGETPIGSLLPVECHTDRKFWGTTYQYNLVPKIPDHPLVAGINWRDVWFFSYNRVDAKVGATTVGAMSRYPEGSPCLVYWDFGRGRSMAWLFDWGGNGAVQYYRWPHAVAVMARMIYYPAGVPIPDDLAIAQAVRRRFQNFEALRRYTVSVVEFADKFGARIDRAERSLRDAAELKSEVLPLYASGMYDEAMAAIDAALLRLGDASAQAISAKNAALVWCYVIEWFVVAGTGMLCGAVLWGLMVKRKLYAEVPTVRLSRRI